MSHDNSKFVEYGWMLWLLSIPVMILLLVTLFPGVVKADSHLLAAGILGYALFAMVAALGSARF